MAEPTEYVFEPDEGPIVVGAKREVVFGDDEGSRVLGRVQHVDFGDEGSVITVRNLPYWDELARDSVHWDRLTLGEELLPGIWEIDSGECKRKLDKKKTKKKDGARTEDLGLEPSTFTVRGKISSKAEWYQLQRAFTKLNPRSRNAARTPLKIYHPAVAFIGVDTVYIQRIQAPQLKSGLLEIALDLVEWTEKPKETQTSKKPKGKQLDLATQQRIANAMATPVSLWYGHAIHVGPDDRNPNRPVPRYTKAAPPSASKVPTGQDKPSHGASGDWWPHDPKYPSGGAGASGSF